MHISHFQHSLLPGLAAGFLANQIDRSATSYLVKPGRQYSVGLEAACASGQIRKNRLRHVLRHLGRADLAQSGRIDQVQMPVYQRAERFLRAAPPVILQQFPVTHRRFRVYRHGMVESDIIFLGLAMELDRNQKPA